MKKAASLILALALCAALAVPAFAAETKVEVEVMNNPSSNAVSFTLSDVLSEENAKAALSDAKMYHVNAGTTMTTEYSHNNAATPVYVDLHRMEYRNGSWFGARDADGNLIMLSFYTGNTPVITLDQAGVWELWFSGDGYSIQTEYILISVEGDAATEAPVSAATAVGGFSDVAESDYFADAVLWAVNHEPQITNGIGNGIFGAKSAVTRAQAVTFLWRAAGEPEPASMTSPFSDVYDSGAWYYKAVLWAAEQGITNGNGVNTFGGGNALSYEQMLTFMARAAGADTSGDWSAKAQAWAQENGLTDGIAYRAADNCPRSDTVYFLWKELAK